MPLRTTAKTIGELGFSLMVFLAFPAFPAFADCLDYTNAQPARLLENSNQNDRILNFVRELRSGEQVRVVKFGAFVNRHGKFENLCCGYSNTDLSSLQYRYYRARLKDLRLMPAIFDGEPLHVFVSLSVVSTQVAGRVETVLLLNQLNSISEFGINYSAPQRISSPYQRRIHGYWGYPIVTEIQALVGPTGSVSNVEMSGSNFEPLVSNKDVGIAVKLVEDSCFVPGKVKNQATEMLYLEGLQ